MSNLPLPQLYSQTLSSLLPILDDTLSISESSTQSKLTQALDQLHLIARMISSLGVFSENEGIDEVGDGELRFMSLGWVVGEAEGKGGLSGPRDRIEALKRSETAFNSFLSLLSMYGVLSPEEQAESSATAQGSKGSRDPAIRREAKIRQYRREKELRQQISDGIPSHPSSSSHPLEFLISLIPSPSNRPSVISYSTSTSSTSVNPEETTETRPTILLLLRLLHTLAITSLSSITMELDLLSSAPLDSESYQSNGGSSDPRQVERQNQVEDDDTWRLDRTLPSRVTPKELISGGGRVLRPFTILPSTQAMSDRERLKGEVFKQSWRLPTMTIDEYLEEERRRGNIITGGGQASYDAPTSSELLELAAENDGTIEGEAKSEEKRLKDENWARFTEENKKGAGNTMNRG